MIKHSPWDQMRSLKRCGIDLGGGGGEVGSGQSRKRRKAGDRNCFLLDVLRDSSNVYGAPYKPFSILQVDVVDDTVPSSSSCEVVSKPRNWSNPPQRLRSPVVMSLLGRTPVLPPRFRGSPIIKTRRKLKPKPGDFCSDFEEGIVSGTDSKSSRALLKSGACCKLRNKSHPKYFDIFS